MRKNLRIWTLTCAFIITLIVMPAVGGVEPIVGKWMGKADTPNGLMNLELEFKQVGNELQGSAILMQSPVPLSAIKFEDPQLSLQLSYGGGDYKLLATVKDGKLKGTWEQIGGDLKGTFNAELQGAPAAAPAGISGDWNLVSQTPNGEVTATLTLKHEKEQLSGLIASDRGSLPIQNASFKADALQFDLDLGGTRYRLEGVLKDDKFVGKWAPAEGGEGGPWSAMRKSSDRAVSAGTAAVSLDGDWNSVATTPNGDLPFKIALKQDGETVTGNLSTPDGSVPIQKGSFSKNRLSFEVTHDGNTYRVEAVLVDGKLSGQWKVADGTDTGAWKAERPKP